MRLGGLARYACTVRSETDLLEALTWASDHSLKFRVIGTGSNVFWHDEGYDGLVIINKLEGFTILDGDRVQIGSGMDWDGAVAETVSHGLSGIEFLSLIPGTTGASPVQNVGAYGREIKDVLVSLRAYDTLKKDFAELSAADCGFGYRTSRFKTTDAGRFIITTITLQLSAEPPKPPFYDSLQKYLDADNATDYTAASIREAVIAIRSAKMPDPAAVANNGSFFANPFIAVEQFESLQKDFPGIVGWPFDGQVKVAAGWLVEQAGFNDFHDQHTGMATWHAQNLVLVNEHARSTADLLTFKQKIVDAVQAKFGITLEQEPELL